MKSWNYWKKSNMILKMWNYDIRWNSGVKGHYDKNLNFDLKKSNIKNVKLRYTVRQNSGVKGHYYDNLF